MERTLDKGMAAGPLAGVKVVEYGVFHAGPGAGAILGDLGADVIKIEAGNGDPERFWTVVGDMDIAGPDGQSIMFEVSNRNKRGIHLDIASETGRAVFDRLVAGADVFLTNLRKSTKAKLGIDYESLKRINPKLVHANVSGYGPEGPMADIGAFDPMGQARSGMMFLYDPKEPKLVHLAVLDQATAICASHAILAALVARERRDIGQEVHASLYGTGLWLLYCNVMSLAMIGKDPSIHWVRHENSPLRNNFMCADGKWIIGVHHPEEKYWGTFCRAIGREDLLEDPRFAEKSVRRHHFRELMEICDPVLATRTRDEWMEIFRKAGLMFTPVQRLAEVIQDPQAIENNYIVEFEHPDHGRISIPGYPAHFSEAEAGMRFTAPKKTGRDTDDILRELGYSEKDIEAMRDQGVVK